jgi:hypothetical protein
MRDACNRTFPLTFPPEAGIDTREPGSPRVLGTFHIALRRAINHEIADRYVARHR